MYDKISTHFPRGGRGETLLEVLVSVSILMLVLAPISGMYIASKRYTEINRRDLQAASLAEEAIEAVIGIHAGNILKFSAKGTACWRAMTWDDNVNANNCDRAASQILAGWHRVIIGPDGIGMLDKSTFGPFVENNPIPFYELVLDEAEGPHNHYFRDTHLYQHNFPILEGHKATGFYRGLKIENTAGGDMRATAVVVYKMGNSIRSVKREVIITPDS